MMDLLINVAIIVGALAVFPVSVELMCWLFNKEERNAQG